MQGAAASSGAGPSGAGAPGSGVNGRTVLIAGATSVSGEVATRALVAAGARVIAVGRSPEKLAPLAQLGAHTQACDLTDETAVQALAERLRADAGAEGVAVDGVLHLVGGWRGGGGLAGQREADYRFLEGSLTALRHVTRAFDAELRAAPVARLAIVSSTAVEKPLAGGANYATVKAACETWMRAVAQGLATAARDRGQELAAAALIFRVTTLDGLEERLARAYIESWNAAAATVNGTVAHVTPAEPGSAA